MVEKGRCHASRRDPLGDMRQKFPSLGKFYHPLRLRHGGTEKRLTTEDAEDAEVRLRESVCGYPRKRILVIYIYSLPWRGVARLVRRSAQRVGGRRLRTSACRAVASVARRRVSQASRVVNLFFWDGKFCKAAWGRGFLNIKKYSPFVPGIRPYGMLVEENCAISLSRINVKIA